MKKNLLIFSILFIASFATHLDAQPVFYVPTYYGGPGNGYGTISRFDASTNALSAAYTFHSDPANPVQFGHLAITSNDKIYGITMDGGNGYGVIYSIDKANGNNFQVVHVFEESTGIFISGNLVLAPDGMLYGTTQLGGANNNGVIFSVNPANNGYTVIYSFGFEDGYRPIGTLLPGNDGKLYGSTINGGIGYGVIFSYDLANHTYSKLYSLASLDGSYCYGGLVEATNGKMYGINTIGGSSGYGTVFCVDPFNNFSFTKILDFDVNKGTNPYGALVQTSNGKLYGLTYGGGATANSSTLGSGVLFSIDPASANSYTKIIDLGTGAASGVANSQSGLFLYTDGKLYGSSNNSTIFKLDPINNNFSIVTSISSTVGYSLSTFTKGNDNKIYASSGYGGSYVFGTVFSLDLQNNVASKLYEFSNPNGVYPAGNLVKATNGKIYGATQAGGIGYGVLFSYDPLNNSYSKVFTLNTDIGYTFGLTAGTNGKVYGISSSGGANNVGVIFDYNPSNNTCTKLYDLNSISTGTGSLNSLYLSNNGKFYGVGNYGGANGAGTLFSFDPSDNSLIKLYDFTTTNGSNPQGDLIQTASGVLYGITQTGGNNGYGVVFSYNPSNNTYTKIFDFDDTNGLSPFSGLTMGIDGKLYGVTQGGGANGYGVIFLVNPANNAFTKIYDFDSHSGSTFAKLTSSSNGKLYGVTENSGGFGRGIVFTLDISKPVPAFSKKADFNGINGSVPLWQSSLLEFNGCTTPVVQISNNGPVCEGNQLQLTASAGDSYTWTGPNNFTSTDRNPVIDNVTTAAAGDYTVIVSNGPACTAAPVSTTVVISTKKTFYLDNDHDGFGDPSTSTQACIAPTGYVEDHTDCNDNDAAVHASFIFYADTDGDGFGTGDAVSLCAADANTAPAGYSKYNTDNCPNTANPDQKDSDHDGIGDACDYDLAISSQLATHYCVKENFTISYTATGIYNTGNKFTAQLSDASGNFTSAVNIGNVNATASGSIDVTIPDNTTAGNGYRIRIVSSNPAATGIDNGSNITINSLPTVSITSSSGNNTLCSAGSLTLTASAGNSWLWSTNATTQQITVMQGATYSVKVTDASGCSNSNDIAITEASPVVVHTTVTNNNGNGQVLPKTMNFSPGGDVTFIGQGPGAKKDGGRTNIYSAINTTAYNGLWWTFTPIANPTHSSQSATGNMAFNNYDASTGIITFTSTANMTWAANSGTESVATRMRIQLQPYTGTHSGQIGSNWITPVTAGGISLSGLPANYPLIDIKALGNTAAFQVWYIVETATGVPIDDYYATFPHTSTVGGQTVTSFTGTFFAKEVSTCNGGPATVTVTATGGGQPYTGTGTFSVSQGQHTFTVTDANGCSGSTTITVAGQDCIQLQCVQNKSVNAEAGSCTAIVQNIDPIVSPVNTSVKYTLERNGEVIETGIGSVSGKSFERGVTTVTYTAVDDASKTCSFTVTVVAQTITYYRDQDNDGFGDAAQSVEDCSKPAGYVTNNTDCDDNNASAWKSQTVYIDADNDGYDAGTTTICYGNNVPAGFSLSTNGEDCKDTDHDIHASFEFYADMDGDTYGTGVKVSQCALNANTPPPGYSLNNTDCNDNDNKVWQSALLYIDADGDGYTNGTATVCYGNAIPDGYTSISGGTDCDDSDPAKHASFLFYVDTDHDGYGTGDPVELCAENANTAPSGYSVNNKDNCPNTSNPDQLDTDHDGIGNVCDNANDDDGDGTPNETDCAPADNTKWQSGTLFIDADGDGYTTGTATVCYGNVPAGYSLNSNGTDCNDHDNSKWTSASAYTDADGDGYDAGSGTVTICYGANLPAGYALTTLGVDCDDHNAQLHAKYNFYVDADNDGFGSGSLVAVCAIDANTAPAGYSKNNTDNCPNTSNPDQLDTDHDGVGNVCDNANDDDGDGTPNETDCAPADNTKWRSANVFIDADGDGYTKGNATICYGNLLPAGYSLTSKGTDCVDTDATIYPGAPEICDGKDNNCNGKVDENGGNTYYRDADGDGYGNPALTKVACSQPTGYVTNNKDCNDGKATVYPGAPELCDGLDNNCNGQVDENAGVTYYRDADGDGYGNPAATKTACTKPSGYVTNNTDCNDNNKKVYPGAVEICDGVDNDCDGLVDENGSTWYKDADGDGYGNSTISVTACTKPAGYVSSKGDCNDANNKVNPGAKEICGNGIDDDCDGQVDEDCTVKICAYGQMAYENNIITCAPNGISSSKQIMQDAADAQPGDSVTFGLKATGRFFTLKKSDIQNNYIYKLLPGSGTSKALKGYATYTRANTWSNVPLSSAGAIQNELLAQTMTLFFNMQLSPQLKSLSLNTNTGVRKLTLCTVAGSLTQVKFVAKPAVATCLQTKFGSSGITVNNLYQLANELLGNSNTCNLNYADVNDAVKAVNELFNGCVAANAVPVINTRSIEERTEEPVTVTITSLQVNTAPNPFRNEMQFQVLSPETGSLKILVYDVNGVKIAELKQDVTKDIPASIPFRVNQARQGVLFYKAFVNKQSVTGKLVQLN